MFSFLKRILNNYRKKKSTKDIEPDEIFLDGENLPQFDTDQFEGRIEKPISKASMFFLGFCFVLVGVVYIGKVWQLQVVKGEEYAQRSERNRLKHTPIFSQRGIIKDRNGVEIAWNIPTDDTSLTLRKYIEDDGFGHVLGYVKYPSKDSYGFYYREDFEGMAGVEKYFNNNLKGTNGTKIVEVDALQRVQSESVLKPPKQGETLLLSIDSKVQGKLYSVIESVANRVGFEGGAGIIMDIHNGEVMALTSYPEYDPEIISLGTDSKKINSYLTNKNKPFLDRVIDGVYTPGSILKPMLAIAALEEKIIDPKKNILSTGSISIPYEHDKTKETIFRDWKAHGNVDMRKAIAVSSDVYFYAIGGGYKDQKGLGILNIEKYTRLFGLGEIIPDSFFTGSGGVIPNPEWKKKNFDGDDWRIGNTYHTAIGQYGFQVTPLQMVRAVGAIATNGVLVYPTIIKDDKEHNVLERIIDISPEYFKVAQEGMRLAVLEGTSQSLKKSYVAVGAKSGTAELGVSKDKVNSWMIGYFPYENPKYAFAVTMEKGSVHNLVGAGVVMGEVLDWMNINTPEYFK